MAAALPEELVEEILVRLPPDDPASLVRAALVCKLWRRLVCAPGFRGTFREFHRGAAPVLGVFCQAESDCDDESKEAKAELVSITASCFRPGRAVHRGCRVIDARHGRVLLQRVPPWPPTHFTSSIDLFVWDPIRDEQRDLPGQPWLLDTYPDHWKAAVMCGRGCSSRGHHHLDCASSSFLVVFVKLKKDGMSTCTYASESGAWEEQQVASTTFPSDLVEDHYELGSGVLVAGALHFMVYQPFTSVLSIGVLRYDLATQEMSAIRLPLSRVAYYDHMLLAMEDGRLGLAAIMDKDKLCLYWPRDGSDATFVLGRVIDLEKLLPVDTPSYWLTDFNFADAIGVLFIQTSDGGLYSVDTKSGHDVKRLRGCYEHCDHIVPYVGFHAPAIVTSNLKKKNKKHPRTQGGVIEEEEATVKARRTKKPNSLYAGPEWVK